MNSIFGWSYPPGAANDPSAPYNRIGRDQNALDAIARLMSGTEWGADTTSEIAEIIKSTGREIAEYVEGELA